MAKIKVKKHFQEYKELIKPPAIGSIVNGKVIEKTGGGFVLAIKNYKLGFLKNDDIKYSTKEKENLKEGDEIEVKIIGEENRAGFIPVSLTEAKKESIWDNLKKMKENKEPLTLKVMSANKGGLLFNVFGIQAFLPVSQLSKGKYPKMENPTPDKIFKELQKFVGKEMKIQFITVEKDKNKLIVKEATEEKE